MIKIFEHRDYQELQSNVNDWIGTKDNVEVKDITFELYDGEDHVIHYAYIWYEKVEEKWVDN